MSRNRFYAFYESQYGLNKDFTYDFALNRLRAKLEDSYKGIDPSTLLLSYPEPPIFASKFARCKGFNNILAIASEDGKVVIHNINERHSELYEKQMNGLQCHNNAVFDVEWDPHQMKLVTASGDHSAKLWNVKPTGLSLDRIFKGHERSVKVAAFRKNDSSSFATGGRDGAILVWDTRAQDPCVNLKADNYILCAHLSNKCNFKKLKINQRTFKEKMFYASKIGCVSITGLAFQDNYNLISSGAGDGIIKVWDLRRIYTVFKGQPIPKASISNLGSTTFKGYTSLSVDESGVKLYANCTDDIIYCYDLLSYSSKPLIKYVGATNRTYYIKSCLSPDGNYLISGSSDEKAYIWNIKNSMPLVSLNGHSVEVTCVAWHGISDPAIITCSDDSRKKIWRIAPEEVNIEYSNQYTGFAEEISEKQKADLNQTLILSDLNEKKNKSLMSSSSTFKRVFSEVEADNENYNKNIKIQKTSSVNSDLIYGNENDLSQLNNENNNNNNNNSKNSIKIQKSSNIDYLSHNVENTNLFSNKIKFNNLPGPSNLTTKSILIDVEKKISQLNVSCTSDLPNYVLTGEAPHLSVVSPKKQNKCNYDWLTKLRKQKFGKIYNKLNDNNKNQENEHFVNEDNNSDNNDYIEFSPTTSYSSQLPHINDSCNAEKCIFSRVGSVEQKNPLAVSGTIKTRNNNESILKYLISNSSKQKQFTNSNSN